MAGGSDVLDRRERVVLAENLAGVAEGTPGEVMLYTGMRWLRYWVRFDSGAERGFDSPREAGERGRLGELLGRPGLS